MKPAPWILAAAIAVTSTAVNAETRSYTCRGTAEDRTEGQHTTMPFIPVSADLTIEDVGPTSFRYQVQANTTLGLELSGACTSSSCTGRIEPNGRYVFSDTRTNDRLLRVGMSRGGLLETAYMKGRRIVVETLACADRRDLPAPQTPKADPITSPAPANTSYVLVLGSFPSESLARQTVTSAAQMVGSSAPATIEPSNRQGVTLYRATLGGYGNKADADAACATLSAAGKSCFTRPAAH